MNRKQLTLLIVLAAVLGGLGYMAWQKGQDPYKESSSKLGDKLLPQFPINDVAQVTIKQARAELNIVKTGEQWTVQERGHHPANFSTLQEFLRKFWEMKVAKPVKVGPSRLPQLELVTPDKGNGTLVEFKDKDGKLIKSLLVGAKHMKDSPGDSPFGGGGFPSGRYVMVGGDIASVSLISDPLSNAEANPVPWLNKDWFKVEKIKTISVTSTNATNNWSLSRETEAGEWKLAAAQPGEQLDTGKSSSVTSALSYPSFEDLATNSSPEATGLGKPLVAKLETFEGFTYTAKVGQPSGENYYFQFGVEGNFPQERVVPKDEKPEDKEKADKDFKDQTAKLQERLKTEKAFEKWTYVVSKWTIDPLLKERKDLLAEKKEEPKTDDKPAASPVPFVPPPSLPGPLSPPPK